MPLFKRVGWSSEGRGWAVLYAPIKGDSLLWEEGRSPESWGGWSQDAPQALRNSNTQSSCPSTEPRLRSVGSHVTDRVLVLWLGVGPEALRWESRVQDIGPPETSWPHVLSIGESSPRDLHLNAKTQLHSTTSKFQRWTPHAKQLARQEYKPLH